MDFDVLGRVHGSHCPSKLTAANHYPAMDMSHASLILIKYSYHYAANRAESPRASGLSIEAIFKMLSTFPSLRRDGWKTLCSNLHQLPQHHHPNMSEGLKYVVERTIDDGEEDAKRIKVIEQKLVYQIELGERDL